MSSLAKRSFYVCQVCGLQAPKWMGRCSGCGEWDSLIEERAATAGAPVQVASDDLLFYTNLDSSHAPRIETGNAEFDRVLGGGLVPGGLILLGGEPGIERRRWCSRWPTDWPAADEKCSIWLGKNRHSRFD